MTLTGWLIGFGLAWVTGYLITKQADYADWVRIPGGILLLVGFVKSPNHPLGVVSARGLGWQIFGILTLAYHFIPTTPLPRFMREWDVIVAWVLAFSLSALIVRLLMWRCRYQPPVADSSKEI